jgi:hypothetical protein
MHWGLQFEDPESRDPGLFLNPRIGILARIVIIIDGSIYYAYCR